MTTQHRAPVASVTPYTQSYYSPDTLFAPKPDADGASAYDAAAALLDMAQATLAALQSNGEDLKKGFSLSHELIIRLLWSVDTQIGMAKAAFEHMADADRAEHLAAVAAAKAQGGVK